ncbi:MAG: 23S rRNA (guanosine(2251)-2'-O)-methyltransferase RlmB [Acidiferrobacteraceae bacterium]
MSDDGDLLCGLHAVRAALSADPGEVERVWFDDRRHDVRLQELVELARQTGVRFTFVPQAKLAELAGGVRHQGVVARRRAIPARSERELPPFLAQTHGSPFMLVLDEVQDPHNVGACLRSAEASGVHGVVLPRAQSAPLTATAIRVSCGAAERVPVFQVANLSRALQQMRDAGLWIVGAVPDAPDLLYDVDLDGPLALVVGGEEKGLRRLTREACDRLVRIPLEGGAQSLNVSVAAGVCLYEAFRQRHRLGRSDPADRKAK